MRVVESRCRMERKLEQQFPARRLFLKDWCCCRHCVSRKQWIDKASIVPSLFDGFASSQVCWTVKEGEYHKKKAK